MHQLQSTSDEQCSHNDQEIARLPLCTVRESGKIDNSIHRLKEALQATHDESQLYAKTTAKLLQAKEEETVAMQREFASKLEVRELLHSTHCVLWQLCYVGGG